MSREIAVNSNTLKNEVDTMTKSLQNLRTKIDESFAAVKELDNMWDGPASIAFLMDFVNDRQTLLDACDNIDNLIGSMSFARDEYEKCEADVKAITDNLKI